MKTFHSGSLGFTNIDSALDFTFKFDIPTIFSLPKIDSNELIGLDILFETGLIDSKSLILKSKLSTNRKIISPKYFKPFIKRFEKYNYEKFKFQYIGPITLFKLLQQENDISLSEVIQFLTPLYLNTIKELSKNLDFIFMVDEPFFKAEDINEIQIIQKFVDDISYGRSEILVHSCNKLNLNNLTSLNKKLLFHVDSSLYNEEEVKSFPSNFSPGFNCISKTILENSQILENLSFNLKYLSFSCGLGLKSTSEMELALSNLQRLSCIK